MREADEEIREIKKEIIESRGLIIKTNNLVNALGADIKSIAKRQAGYERRFNLNSAAVYVIVAALSFIGLKLASDARIREIQSAMSGMNRQNADLRRDLAEETRRAEERARAEAKAGRYYDLIRAQKRAEVVDGYEGISQENLTRAERAFFRDTYDRFRLDLSLAAYQSGLALMRTGRYAEAAEKLQESMRLKDDAAHLPAVKHSLATALWKLGRQSEAMVYARQVIEQNIDRELQDDGLLLFAQCAQELGDVDTSRETLRTLLRRWPRSSFASDARDLLRNLAAARRSDQN